MKKSMYHRSPNERMIHIKAESDIYSVNEVVREKFAVKRLQQIRDSWKGMEKKFNTLTGLKVTTGVHNPELFS